MLQRQGAQLSVGVMLSFQKLFSSRPGCGDTRACGLQLLALALGRTWQRYQAERWDGCFCQGASQTLTQFHVGGPEDVPSSKIEVQARGAGAGCWKGQQQSSCCANREFPSSCFLLSLCSTLTPLGFTLKKAQTPQTSRD